VHASPWSTNSATLFDGGALDERYVRTVGGAASALLIAASASSLDIGNAPGAYRISGSDFHHRDRTVPDDSERSGLSTVPPPAPFNQQLALVPKKCPHQEHVSKLSKRSFLIERTPNPTARIGSWLTLQAGGM